MEKSSLCCMLYTFNFLIIPLIKHCYIITLRLSESFTVFYLVSQFVFRLSPDGSHGVSPLCHGKVRGLCLFSRPSARPEPLAISPFLFFPSVLFPGLCCFSRSGRDCCVPLYSVAHQVRCQALSGCLVLAG